MKENSDQDEENVVKVKHEYADEYRLVPATGVTGGVQPQGNVKLDFVIDHNRRVEEERYHFADDGSLVRGDMDFGEANIREHSVGVTLSEDDAYYAGCWIIAEILGGNIDANHIHELLTKEFSEESDQQVNSEENEESTD